MTQERIIIEEEMEFTIANSNGKIFIEGFYDYEPAPPKDWRPFCYIYDDEKDECDWSYWKLINLETMMEQCKECIYRKKE